MSFGIALLVMLYVPSGVLYFRENYKNLSRHTCICILQVLVYPFMLPLNRFKNICDNKNKNHTKFLENLRFLIDVPLKLLLFAILMLSTEDLFDEKRTLLWYVHIKFEGWNNNILHIQMVSFISCLFYAFIMTKTLFKLELCNNLLDGFILLLCSISTLYFHTIALIISLVYLEFYGLILVFILFGIFLGMRRHEDGCIFKCITMLLNPISDICQVCEVSKISLHSIHMILCLVMINGNYLNHDKWTILRWAS